MKLGITLAHHDHDYVARRGGFELLTHLRSARPRSDYRREAISRAYAAFVKAEHEQCPDAEVAGVGLVVLQRSLLAAEDLGGLLHALPGPDHWHKLRSTNIEQLDSAYEQAATHPDYVLAEAFRLSSDSDLKNAGLTTAEIEAFSRLRLRLKARWHGMLLRVARLWVEHRNVAKATMHGFPVVAGAEVFGPPRAGFLANGVSAPSSRWALAVSSTERNRNVNTLQTPVALDRRQVSGYFRDGKCAARLYHELCDLHAHSAMTGHKAGIPTRLVRSSSDSDDLLIEQAIKRLSA